MNDALKKLTAALQALDVLTPNKTAYPVFVGGIKYPSLFYANFNSGISSVSIWKAIKRRGGGPAQVRKTFVVLEAWVISRTDNLKGNYQL